MKYLKKGLMFILTTLIVLFTLSSIYSFVLIVHENYEYKQYLNEEKEIYVSLDTTTKYREFSYNSIEYYKSYFQEEADDYLKIKNLDYVEEFNFHNYYLFELDESEVWLSGENDFTVELLEGRTFTEEEYTNLNNVGIFSKTFAAEKGLSIGDTYVLKHPLFDLTPIGIEVIGIHDETCTVLNVDNRAVYMPFNTVMTIFERWLDELTKDGLGEKNGFMPLMLIGNEIIKVNSEEDYLKLCDYIDDVLSQGRVKYSYQRVNSADNLMNYDTSEYKEYLIFSLIVTFILVNILVCTKKLFDIKFRKSEKKFEKELMVEKEKNVQDVFQMNQETHQLKHDMKHFLIQLSSLIENDEKEKGLQLIHEYYEDIESLELPVYTQNNTIDVLINHYSKKAKKLDIDFTYSGNLVNELKVNERKLFILLSNALDNAFNHCDENKNVNMSLTYVEPYHRFTIINTFNKNEEQSNDPEHGHGMNSMKKIVSEMNGEILFEEKDNKFICTILIPVENN